MPTKLAAVHRDSRPTRRGKRRCLGFVVMEWPPNGGIRVVSEHPASNPIEAQIAAKRWGNLSREGYKYTVAELRSL